MMIVTLIIVDRSNEIYEQVRLTAEMQVLWLSSLLFPCCKFFMTNLSICQFQQIIFDGLVIVFCL